MSAWKIILILAATAAVAALIPLTTLNCPSWDVWISDENGRPVPGITVRLSYKNYSAECESHEIDAITDSQGHVKFSPKTLTASLGSRVAAIASAARAGVHASFGPHAWVFAFGNGLEGYDIDPRRNVLVDWDGKPDQMQSRIVVTPRRP